MRYNHFCRLMREAMDSDEFQFSSSFIDPSEVRDQII